jgi:mRNA-degrading endonuclease RelE of RelBE toxin-antitoxin system
MTASFRVISTPSFEREFRAITKQSAVRGEILVDLVSILRQDPYNRTGRHKIKKLVGLKAGDGQWRLRWQDYRLRYDISGDQVILHSFRHRKDAY